MAKARDIPGLHAELSYREAAALTVAVRAQELFEQADGVLDTSDIERVHDMRVASRRLRAVLEIYEPCFPRKALREVLDDVKALADALGERRDPDVQLAQLEEFGSAVEGRRPSRHRAVRRPRPRRAERRQRDARRRAGRASRRPTCGAACRRWRGSLACARSAPVVRPAAAGRPAAGGLVKARRVKGLDPDGALADNLERIVATRLDELCSFVPKALDPARVKALHDMRIAAKRLRYILEVGAEPCFGPYAHDRVKRAKELQDLLGEIHDCDVQLPRVRALLEELRAADALEARARAGDAPDLDPTLASGHAARRLPGAAWRRWPSTCEARRGLLFERFLELWQRPGARRLPRAPGVRDQRAPRAVKQRPHRQATARPRRHR